MDRSRSPQELARDLERRGDLDRAAFVLAELLRRPLRAVELYERHESWREAAGIAEATELEPSLVVRLWFLAGDADRAVEVAVARDAFAGAVRCLEGAGDPRAVALRRLWAEQTADAHRWAEAIGILWADRRDALEVPERDTIEGWFAAATAGPCSTRDAVHLLLLRRDFDRATAAERSDVLDRWRGLVADPGHHHDVVAALDAWERPSPALVRTAVRTVLAGMGSGLSDPAPSLEAVGRVVRRAADPALVTEWAELSAGSGPLGSREDADPVAPLDLRIERSRHATLGRIVGAVPLPGGRVLVALGESGSVELDRRGRVHRRFPEPADALVVADHGRCALTLARREERARLGRIDLDRGSAERWTDVRVARVAPTYDGAVWLVVADGALWLIDARAPDWRSLWRVPDLPGPVLGRLARDPSGAFAAVVADQVWCWDRGLVLRDRLRFPPEAAEAGPGSWTLAADGSMAFLVASAKPWERDRIAWIDREGRTGELVVGPLPEGARIERVGAALAISAGDTWRLVGKIREGGRVEEGDGARVVFEGAERVGTRAGAAGRIALWDDLGRLVVLDAERGGVLVP